MRPRPRPAMGVPVGITVLAVGLGVPGSVGCDEGLPSVELELSKNCNEVVLETLAARVGDGAEVLDVAADGVLGQTAWVLLRRPGTSGETEAVVQQVGPMGVHAEVVLPTGSPSLLLQPAAEAGQVWVVRDEPGTFQVWRVAPEDPVRPLLDSDELSSFPSEGLCGGCGGSQWPRRLISLPSGPAIASMPTSSLDAGLQVWVGTLDTDGARIRLTREHRLNFEPPCAEDESPEAEAFCEEQRMNLKYPAISLLGVQQDPRQATTVLFGHRTRSQTYDGDPFPLESADVFMVTVSLDGNGDPAGVLRSYSGFYDGADPPGASVPPLPTADPPYGVAIDRFAAYGLFSNGGQLARLIKLPDADPEYDEISSRVPLSIDTSLLQLDRDLAMGRVVDGAWEITKLFPDDPSQSRFLVHEGDGPITSVRSGGIGTFLVNMQGAAPDVVRIRCPDVEPNEPS